MTHPWIGLRPWQRHSLVLAVAGFVYTVFGILLALVPRNPTQRLNLRMALELFPVSVWSGIWITVGLLSLASTRWPPSSKTWGYTALTGLAVAWGSMYLLGVIFLHAPFTTLSGTLVWWLVGFLWWGISGLVNPDDLVLHHDHLVRAEEE